MPVGHISDLLWPTINFFIFLIIVVRIFRERVTSSFVNYVKEVRELYDFATKKDEEAQSNLEMYQKRIQTFDQEEKQIREELKRDKDAFKERIDRETMDVVATLHKEGQKKIQNEREIIISNLNKMFIENIVDQARKTLKNNKETRLKITKTLVMKMENEI